MIVHVLEFVTRSSPPRNQYPLSSGFDSGVVSSCTARVRCHGVCFLQAKIYRLSKAAHTRGVIEGNGERGNERAHALRVLNRGSPKSLRDRPLQSPEGFGRFPSNLFGLAMPPRAIPPIHSGHLHRPRTTAAATAISLVDNEKSKKGHVDASCSCSKRPARRVVVGQMAKAI